MLLNFLLLFVDLPQPPVYMCRCAVQNKRSWRSSFGKTNEFQRVSQYRVSGNVVTKDVLGTFGVDLRNVHRLHEPYGGEGRRVFSLMHSWSFWSDSLGMTGTENGPGPSPFNHLTIYDFHISYSRCAGCHCFTILRTHEQLSRLTRECNHHLFWWVQKTSSGVSCPWKATKMVIWLLCGSEGKKKV